MRAWAIKNRVESVTRANYQGEIRNGKAPPPRSAELKILAPVKGRVA